MPNIDTAFQRSLSILGINRCYPAVSAKHPQMRIIQKQKVSFGLDVGDTNGQKERKRRKRKKGRMTVISDPSPHKQMETFWRNPFLPTSLTILG